MTESSSPTPSEAQRKDPQTAPIDCPRCGLKSTTRFRFGAYVCACGWLIKVEPRRDPAGNPYLAADAVIRSHYEQDPDGTQLPLETLSRDVDSGDLLTPSQVGMRRILRDWQRRGLARVEIDKASGRFGLRLPSHEDVHCEQ